MRLMTSWRSFSVDSWFPSFFLPPTLSSYQRSVSSYELSNGYYLLVYFLTKRRHATELFLSRTASKIQTREPSFLSLPIQVNELLVHINKRLNMRTSVQLPLPELLEVLQQKHLPPLIMVRVNCCFSTSELWNFLIK